MVDESLREAQTLGSPIYKGKHLDGEVHKYLNTKIIIVSNDNDYKAVIDYLNKNNRKGIMTTQKKR